jgi:hypothetical protein
LKIFLRFIWIECIIRMQSRSCSTIWPVRVFHLWKYPTHFEEPSLVLCAWTNIYLTSSSSYRWIDYLRSLGTDHIENMSSKNSSIVASCSYSIDRVQNIASHFCCSCLLEEPLPGNGSTCHSIKTYRRGITIPNSPYLEAWEQTGWNKTVHACYHFYRYYCRKKVCHLENIIGEYVSDG